MRDRVPQPPIQPALREREAHDFWPAFICALAGLIILFVGARHITGIDTTDGGIAFETQLIKAFSSGGVQYVDRAARPVPRDAFGPPGLVPPPPERSRDEPLEGPRWIVKVNLGARTPCPT